MILSIFKLAEVLCLIPLYDGGISLVDVNGDPVDDEEPLMATEKIYFTCEEGFEVVGPKEAVCGNDGQFDPGEDDLPFCQGKYQMGFYQLC